MSPIMNFDSLTIGGFPRVSGDEPEQEATDGAQAPFSPRERG